jgi:hypothetical protein
MRHEIDFGNELNIWEQLILRRFEHGNGRIGQIRDKLFYAHAH